MVGDTQKWYEENYTVLEALGLGATGRVLRASRKKDGKEVALKLLDAPDEQVVSARKKEFEMLQNLQHPNIVEAIDFMSSGTQAIVVLNFIQGSTLDVTVKATERKCFSEEISRDLIHQLMSAVNYLHSRRVVHRDIKAQNVIISPDQTGLHLLDFNTAKSLKDGGAYTMTGTMEYASPEVLDGHSPSEKHDVWCTGLCLHLMITGSLPHSFSRYRNFEEFTAAVFRAPVNWQSPQFESASSECKDVVRKCLTLDMACRPALLLVLRMEWFFFQAPLQPRVCSVGADAFHTAIIQSRSKSWTGASHELFVRYET